MRFFVVSLIIIAIPLHGWSESPGGKAPLDIGIIVPLTGPLAEYGQAVQNGLNLAQSIEPEVKHNCNFIVEDSKYDSKVAISAFQKLVSSEKVGVIYNWGGPTTEALAPLAERNNVAMFVWSADPAVAENHGRVIRFANSGADYGGVLAKFLAKKGYTKIGIVKTENQYIDAILSGLNSSLEKGASIQIIDAYQPGDQDFRATVTKLKAREYEALGVFLLSGQVSQFLTQLKAQNLHPPIFGTDFFESLTEVRQAHGAMAGACFANNEVSADFRDVYVKEFKNDLQINHAASGYDFAVFMCKVLEPQLKSHSPQAVFDRAMAVGFLQGKQGAATFVRSDRGDKYFRFPVVLRLVKDDAIVTVDR